MKYLLDTHIILWMIDNQSKLSEKALKILQSEEDEFFFSMASVWEVAIKHKKSPKDMPMSEEDFFRHSVDSGLILLSVHESHIFAIKELNQKEDNDHKDPFDRLLVAQAKTEGMQFVTHDEKIFAYTERCIERV